MVKNLPAMRAEFNPWSPGGKIPGEGPGEVHGQRSLASYSPWEGWRREVVPKSWTQLSD